jgi:tetratricopeptide (TPR) repeat protein
VSALRRRVVAAALAVQVIGGCAAWTPPLTARLQQRRPEDLPARVELAGTPFFAQTPYHCGPAALATVLTDGGWPADPDELARHVFLPARQGTLQDEMLAGARRAGAVAQRLPPQLESLLREVAAGTPVVVLLNLGLSLVPRWHYAVVIGYDLDEQHMVLRSGTTQRELLSLRTFEHTWARSNHWAFVVLPPERLAGTLREADAVAALVGFERVAQAPASARAYATAAQRWPGNLTLAMGHGNALYAAGRIDEAATVLDAAARRHDSAAAWNNLALVQLQRGDRRAARDAAQRALLRAESAEPQWLPAVRSTIERVARP